MERGEWWLDESGYETFADGDVGDTNHEAYALRAALGLDDEDPDDEEFFNAPPLSKAQVAQLRERGVDERALAFFSKRGADARDYAVEVMGWVRVKGRNFEVWELDDARLEHIQRADFWDEEDIDSEESIYLEERHTGAVWEPSMKVLHEAPNAAAFKARLSGSGRFRGYRKARR